MLDDYACLSIYDGRWTVAALLLTCISNFHESQKRSTLVGQIYLRNVDSVTFQFSAY